MAIFDEAAEGTRLLLAKAVGKAASCALALMLALAIGMALPGSWAFADDEGTAHGASSTGGTALQAVNLTSQAAPANHQLLTHTVIGRSFAH